METAELKSKCGVLREGSRSEKIAAAQALGTWLTEAKAESEAEQEAVELVHEALVAALDNEAEAVRSAACKGLRNTLEKRPATVCEATRIINAIRARLAPQVTAEPAEELRLDLLRLAGDLLQNCAVPSHLSTFYDEYVEILIKCLGDEFSDVKKEACDVVVVLAEQLSKEFHMRSEVLMENMLTNLSHRHTKVRQAAARCIGTTVMNGSVKCLELCLTSIHTLLVVDDISTVRLQVIKEVGNWMLNHRDRYSYWQHLIIIMLSGVCDTSDDVRNEATEIWDKVGLQYIAENEDELGPKLEYGDDPPCELLEPRPNLGCRTLVIKYMRKLVQVISLELENWQSNKRLLAAKILTQIIIHCEKRNLYFEMTDIFLNAVKDENEEILAEAQRGAENLGRFIKPNQWIDSLISMLDAAPGLVILAHLIKGTPQENLEESFLKSIMKELTLPRIMNIRKADYQMSSLNVCESLINAASIYCQSVSHELFNKIFTIFAMPCTPQIENYALCLIEKLRETIKIGSNIDDFYCIYIRSVLVNITSEACFWGADAPEALILRAIVVHTGAAVGLHLHLLAPLLVEVSSTKVSSEIRLNMLTSLCSMLLQRDERLKLAEPSKLKAFMNVILEGVIQPNLEWYPGQNAELLRSAAVCCLCAILQDTDTMKESNNNVDFEKCTTPIELFTDAESLEKYMNVILPLLVGFLNDRSKNTRTYSLRAIYCLVKLAKKHNCFKVEHLHNSYAEVISSLDDSNDTVRRYAIETLCLLFLSRPEPYDVITYNVHVDAMYNAMLIHLDDPDTTLQEDILLALKKVCIVHPKLLKEKLEKSFKLYKNQKALEHLDKHLETLTI